MKRLHDGTETADYRVHHHHDCRRRITSIATPLGEGGRKAERGIGSPVPTSNCRSQRPAPEASPEAQRRATCHGTTTSSRISRLPGDTNRPNGAAVMANGGGLATTLNGCRDSQSSAASAMTALTGSRSNRCLNKAAPLGCSFTATTRAPLVTSDEVIAPVPAPTSRTRSPGLTRASTTIRSAYRLSS
jgi:hypothetical protein